MIWRTLYAALPALALAAQAHAAPGAFVDVLDAPAQKSPLAAQRLLNGAAAAGNRLVVVGQRGHVLYSDDQGKTWTQASVPVSADLVAVHFPTATQGWAVGHSGIVLATTDAGTTWVKQLDGRMAAQAMVDHYTAAGAAAGAGGAEALARLQEEAKRYLAEGPDKPFLDVWFDDASTGYIVGLFNLVFRTDDGGRRWVPWFDRTDNPRRQNFYAVRRVGGELYIAGEQGLVLKLEPRAQRFQALPTPYDGTYFGITGANGSVVVFGLRGNAYRSTDAGATWRKVETGIPVGLNGATVLPDGRIVLVSQAGHVLASSDAGASFAQVALERPLPAASVAAAAANRVIVAGPRGVHAVALP